MFHVKQVFHEMELYGNLAHKGAKIARLGRKRAFERQCGSLSVA